MEDPKTHSTPRISVGPLLIQWVVMCSYWLLTSMNALRYYRSVVAHGSFDSYSVYLYHQQFLDFPARALDECFHISSSLISAIGTPSAEGIHSSLSVLAQTSVEIMAVDFFMGSAVWLLTIGLVVALTRRLTISWRKPVVGGPGDGE